MMLNYGYATSSISSSDTMSGSIASRQSQVRTVRMNRKNFGSLNAPIGLNCKHGPSLGFSIRGGREHGTGFFISHVDPGSEAYRQSLKVCKLFYCIFFVKWENSFKKKKAVKVKNSRNKNNKY